MTTREECTDTSVASYTFEEVSRHRSRDDKWLVVDGVVYNVSSWQYQHPGGRRVLGYFAGQDATVSTTLVFVFRPLLWIYTNKCNLLLIPSHHPLSCLIHQSREVIGETYLSISSSGVRSNQVSVSPSGVRSSKVSISSSRRHPKHLGLSTHRQLVSSMN